MKNLFIRNYLALLNIYIRRLLNVINIGNVSNIKKRKFIASAASRKGIKTLIETGTYFGHSTVYFSKKFDRVYTIEISNSLFNFTSKKFRRYQNIDNYLGNSSDLLDGIIDGLDVPALFFLDGHASGGVTASGDTPTPVKKELASLQSFKYLRNSIIFIDDAVGFDGTNSYPSFEEIEQWCRHNELEKPKIELEMITIYPKSKGDSVKVFGF